ncbi:MAG: 3-oxoacyl-ACP reductase FabG [Buchnera aphidicola (Kaburagia rhusicola ensigallis)]
MNFKKIALVTGASHGIGKGIAKKLVNQGITVIGTSKSQHGKNIINNYLKNKGIGIILNTTNTNSIEKTIKNIYNDFKYIDILINNIGIVKDKLLINMTYKEWNDVININLNSIFHISKPIVKNMTKKRKGKIITIGSIMGHIGNHGQTNYSASKSGLIGFHRSLALEVAHKGICINMIAPGFIETRITKHLTQRQINKYLSKIPMKKLGTINEISEVVLFLISDRISYITGQVIHINGGMYMP